MFLLKNELYILKQMFIFTGRHLRYFKIALILYLAQFQLGRKAATMRAGFTLLQIIDDLLDGDRPSMMEPHREISSFSKRFKNRQWDPIGELDHLAEYFISRLDQNPYRAEIIRKTEELIDVMLLDRWRVKHAHLWSGEQIMNQHHKTFGLSLDITLGSIESPLRAHHMPEILELFGWCSTMRDLREDLLKGLCNIPREILYLCSAHKISTQLLHEKPVLTWIQLENDRAARLLGICEAVLTKLPKIRGYLVFKIFVKSMRSFYTRFSKKTLEAQTPLQAQQSF